MTPVSGRAVEARVDEPPALNRGDRDLNPPGIGLLALLREDFRNHDGKLMEQGFWAIAVHRFGNWRMGVRFKPLRAPLTILYRVMYHLVEIAAGISLPYTVRLGRRVRIWHHSGIIINARSIGDDTQIRQNTTMGVIATGRNLEIPTIGERVDIGCGVCILGGVTVGDDCTIGANALVTVDVPPHSMAFGVPARIVPKPDREGRP
jgi:serine O-acetyltransferase